MAAIPILDLQALRKVMDDLRVERGGSAPGQSRLGIDSQDQAFQPLPKGILAKVLEPGRTARPPYELRSPIHPKPPNQWNGLSSGREAGYVNGGFHCEE